jgi:hypothetical protein
MSESRSQDPVSRRKALKIIVGSAGAAVSLPVLHESGARACAAECHVARPAAAPFGPARAPKFFNESQVKTLEALSETIIPADQHSPGAKAARVPEYIDEIIADADESTKSLWTLGLTAVDKMAEQEYQKKFADCAPSEQIALLEKIARNEEHPSTPEDRFFVAVKRATIDGYYTSAIGIHQDLEYQGNTALPEFPGCTHPEHRQ